MNILEKIVRHKKKEVEILKQQFSHRDFEQSEFFDRETISLKQSLLNSKNYGIIAEFKRKSPSKGIINATAKPEIVTSEYEKAGVAGVSILTDNEFFGGSANDVMRSRPSLSIPVLRKEFIVDEFQILHAKSIGADAILLIAECLDQVDIKRFTTFSKKLGLDVLLELHSEEMLDRIVPEVDIVGVNNRNLKTFEVSIQTSIDLYDKIPSEFVRISESGVSEIEEIKTLSKVGFQGFLIGENFMKSDNPGESCNEFIKELISQ